MSGRNLFFRFFLMITHGNKASLYHEATGVPEGVPQKKNTDNNRPVSELLSAYPDVQLSIFVLFRRSDPESTHYLETVPTTTWIAVR